MAAELTIDYNSTGAATARRDMARTRSEVERFGSSTTKLGSAAGKSEGKLGRFAGRFAGFAVKGGALAIAGAGALVLKFGADSLQAASDTQQAMGAVDSVFGRNAKKVRAWATGAADSVGLAKSEYGNLAAVLGSMLKNTGIENYAAKTKDLIGLGSDLASTYGGTTKEAVEALGSLLRGETDPIEKYGVSIKQSGVNAILAARGQSKLTGAARTQAEQQARLKLLTQQTTKAQGQFARESNTLAGSQQRLGAKFTNLKSTLGQKLLPVATKIVSWLSATISGSNRTAAVLRKVGTVLRSYLTPLLRGAKDAWKEITSAIQDSKKKGDGFGSLMRGIGKLLKKLAPIVGKLVGGQFKAMGKAIGGTIRVINACVNAIKDIIHFAKSAGDAIGNLIGKLKSLPGGALGKLKGLGGIFRSAPGTGLVRAGGGGGSGGGFGGSPSVSFAPSLTMSPIVHVSIGRRELKDVVVEIVQGVFREQDRRDNAGGDRE